MIRLSLADGTRIHLNPAAICYIEQLADLKTGDKDQARTKIVLMTGEALSVRQTPYQILMAAGGAVPIRKKIEASEADESDE